MLKAFYELLDRLDRAQSRTLFRVVATIVGVVAVGSAFGLTLSGKGDFLPEAFRENLISSTALALAAVIGIVWLNRTLTAIGFLLIGIPVSLIFQFTRHPQWAKMTLGIIGLAVLFTLALQLLRLLFSLPWRPLAVARLVVDEAIRLKIALIFIVAVLIFIPLLAATLDPTEALRYRIQTFLSYGTGTSYGLLAVMTLFLSTATVAFEQREKTIFQVISKPVSRLEYLLGKWIGVMGLNAVLLVLVSGSIFWLIQYMRTLPAQDIYDRLAVSEQVLTARVGVRPSFDVDFDAIRQQVDEIVQLNREVEDTPAARSEIEKRLITEVTTKALTVDPGEFKDFLFENVEPLSRTIIRTATPGESMELDDSVKTILDIEVWDENEEHAYSPGVHFIPENTGDDNRNASIRILPEENQKAADYGIYAGERLRIRYFPANSLTLRFKINSGSNDPGVHFPITIGVADTPFFEVREVALIQMQTMLIPAGAVGRDGKITIRIINGDVQTQTGMPAAIKFPPDGLEVMYKVSTFEPNYFRAMLIDWLKLGFLAMLGICAATFASFPVACLLAFVVYFGAQTGPFLADSLQFYRTVDIQTQETVWIKLIISTIAKGVYFILKGFQQVRPTERLIDGRNIPWSDVSSVFLTITLLWTGVTALIGWAVFRSRQLAIYSGHS